MNGTDFFFSVGRGGSAVFYRSAVTAPKTVEDCSLVEPDCDPWEGAPEYWLNWELIETLSSVWESKHPFRA